MSKFIIEQSFWDIFSECEIGILVINDIDNTEDGCKEFRGQITEFLEKANEEAKKYITEPVLSQNRVISVWRDGQRTMLTENTKNAIAVIESVDPSRHADLEAALDTLSARIEKVMIGKVNAKMIMNKDCSALDIK